MERRGRGGESSRSQMFFKIVALKNFTILAEIHLCFSVNIAKFLRTAFYSTPPVAASGETVFVFKSCYEHMFCSVKYSSKL